MTTPSSPISEPSEREDLRKKNEEAGARMECSIRCWCPSARETTIAALAFLVQSQLLPTSLSAKCRIFLRQALRAGEYSGHVRGTQQALALSMATSAATCDMPKSGRNNLARLSECRTTRPFWNGR